MLFIFIDVYDNVKRNQIVVRTAPTNWAGHGSVVAQLRSSAAIATMLGASFATFGVISEHNYKSASVLQLDLPETSLDPGSKVCSVAYSPNYARTVELVTSWCDNVTQGDAHARELQRSEERRVGKECW